MHLNKRLTVIIATITVAAVTVSLVTITMLASAERPVGISVTKLYSGPVPNNIKSITITSQQLSNVPMLQKAIDVVEANHVNGAVYPLGFEGQITSAEATQLTQLLPFTEATKPDETFRSFYAAMVVGENMYLVALYFA